MSHHNFNFYRSCLRSHPHHILILIILTIFSPHSFSRSLKNFHCVLQYLLADEIMQKNVAILLFYEGHKVKQEGYQDMEQKDALYLTGQ